MNTTPERKTDVDEKSPAYRLGTAIEIIRGLTSNSPEIRHMVQKRAVEWLEGEGTSPLFVAMRDDEGAK